MKEGEKSNNLVNNKGDKKEKEEEKQVTLSTQEDKKTVQQELKAEKEKEKENKDYEALWDKYLRLGADFDNARKRWEREKEEILKFGNFQLIKELVVILDELEQALSTMKKRQQDEEIIKGIEMTYSNFWNILQKNGLKPIEMKGKRFDPYLCEIVGKKEEKDVEDEPIVIEEVQKGYVLRDKVLRTSKVIVGVKKIAPPQESKNEKEEKGSNNEKK